LDGDGDLDDQIRIPDRKIGEYIIEVIPEPDALPTDTYTLEVLLFGEPFLLAVNTPISDIPAQPYRIIVTETEIILPFIQASIDLDPDVLNLNSKGRWITTYIELPEGYSVSDIDVSTVKLSEEDNIIASAEWGEIQNDVLMVKFDRTTIIAYLNGKSGEVTLSVSGKLASDDIRGIDTLFVKSNKKSGI